MTTSIPSSFCKCQADQLHPPHRRTQPPTHFQESLEREFTASLARLTPLLARIQQTDALIDQVVYQLYGLTDEEIAVVEGKI